MSQNLTLNRFISNGIGICFKKKSFLLVGFLFLLQTLLLTPLYAQGVAAGTNIANTVIVNYQIGGETQIPIESSPAGNKTPGIGNGEATIFKVDRKIDLSLTGNSNANVAPGDIQAEVTYTLKNEGNAIQEFSLIPDSNLTTDSFDTSNCTTVVTSITGSALPGVAIPTNGNIKLRADQQASISIKCDIPLENAGQAILSGDTSLISLYATAEKNEDGSAVQESNSADSAINVETVFADGTGPDDSNKDAMYTARRTFTAINSTSSAELSMLKSIVSTRDPQGGNKAISGSEVTYKISINITGTGFIDNLVISDLTPVDMSYKPESILLNNNNLTDNNDSDFADFGISTPNTATINLGSVAAGIQHEIQLSYTIN